MDSDLSRLQIPVVVDSVKRLPRFALTRCTYFSIESKTPSVPMTLGLYSNERIPFLMFGLSGVITRPLGEKALFENAEDFEDLFRAVEEHSDLYVDTNDIWLPTQLFEMDGQTARRGMVYRIGESLFRTAYAFREEELSHTDVMDRLESLNVSSEARFCESETQALAAWQPLIIERIRKIYHDNPDKKLKKKEVKKPGDKDVET